MHEPGGRIERTWAVTAPVVLGLLGAVSVVSILSFTGWRLWVIDRQQAQLFQDLLRLQGESRSAQQQVVRAIDGSVRQRV
jgi:hypothetical protein